MEFQMKWCQQAPLYQMQTISSLSKLLTHIVRAFIRSFIRFFSNGITAFHTM